ncbi:hypothetical protein ACXR2U_18665 [Jatrophihabitans sp. YIM 134969]
MDTSLFRPDHDLDGRRQRSLALYGVDASFRASDGIDTAFQEIVDCATLHVGAHGATLLLWPSQGPLVLAQTDDETTSLVTQLGNACLDTDDTATVAAALLPTGDVVTTAVLVGHERIGIGVLAVRHIDGAPPDPLVHPLLRQLTRAALHLLDEQRRILQRRTPPTRRLRVVDGDGGRDG